MSKKAIVIDGNSLIYRVFYATYQQLDYYKKNNLPPANAIRLVASIVLKLLNENQYDYALFALDSHKKTFRTEQFEDYKAGRKPMPEELLSQLEDIKNIVSAIGLNIEAIPGIEADDIIGSYCKIMNDSDVDVTIFTSDRDMLQLVSPKTSVSFFVKGISVRDLYTEQNFCEKFMGLKPCQIPDFKGISGDSSDNLTGVKGIGPKTAVSLLQKYGSLDDIYNHINELNETQAKKFNECKGHAKLCKSLATIRLDVLNNRSINEFLTKNFNVDEFEKIITYYKLDSLRNLLK